MLSYFVGSECSLIKKIIKHDKLLAISTFPVNISVQTIDTINLLNFL